MYVQALGVTERAQVAVWSGVISGSAALTMAVLTDRFVGFAAFDTVADANRAAQILADLGAGP